MGAGGGRGGAGAICNESLRMKRQLVCTFVAPNNELIRITLGLMSPSRLRMCVCVCPWKTRRSALASRSSNHHSPLTRSHLFTRNNEQTFILWGHTHNADIHHTEMIIHSTGQHVWHETARITTDTHTSDPRHAVGHGHGRCWGGGGGSVHTEPHVTQCRSDRCRCD